MYCFAVLWKYGVRHLSILDRRINYIIVQVFLKKASNFVRVLDFAGSHKAVRMGDVTRRVFVVYYLLHAIGLLLF